jgi:hypothetical protein
MVSAAVRHRRRQALESESESEEEEYEDVSSSSDDAPLGTMRDAKLMATKGNERTGRNVPRVQRRNISSSEEEIGINGNV